MEFRIFLSCDVSVPFPVLVRFFMRMLAGLVGACLDPYCRRLVLGDGRYGPMLFKIVIIIIVL